MCFVDGETDKAADGGGGSIVGGCHYGFSGRNSLEGEGEVREPQLKFLHSCLVSRLLITRVRHLGKFPPKFAFGMDHFY